MRGEMEGSNAHAFWRGAYRALLPLMPSGLRERQGDAMLELFARELRRSDADGARAVWVAGLTGLADLARRGVYERLSEERRELTATNLTILRNTVFAFTVTCVVLTALFVAKRASAGGAPDGSVVDVILFSIPYTTALTIPMSVFIAVLWAASAVRRGDQPVSAGRLRIAPVVGMASVVALCCVVLNSELVPRANLRLKAVYTGAAAATLDERSMTLHQLREAEEKLLSGQATATTLNADGQTVASLEVEVQKKFGLAAACVVLALLAAGIASRAPHLNLVSQAGISLIVFGSYYTCIIMGEQLVDLSAISPALAMWGANIVLLVLAALALRPTRIGSPAMQPASRTL